MHLGATNGVEIYFLLFLCINLLGLVPPLLRMWEVLNPPTSLLNLAFFIFEYYVDSVTSIVPTKPQTGSYPYGHSKAAGEAKFASGQGCAEYEVCIQRMFQEEIHKWKVRLDVPAH
ncbi:hypothetical protein BDQ17DRAFT_1335931 [Cyathus striatus]|nr:hypothetical protein BDQ17DRAFT_1335931 [Cyathus striatus]